MDELEPGTATVVAPPTPQISLPLAASRGPTAISFSMAFFSHTSILNRLPPLRAALIAGVALVVSAPYYQRNVAVFGTPFQLSRDFPLVSRVEGKQRPGRRAPADYLRVPTGLFVDPAHRRAFLPLALKEGRSSVRAVPCSYHATIVIRFDCRILLFPCARYAK